MAALAAAATIASAQDTTRVIAVDTLAITVTRGVELARAPAAISVIDNLRLRAARPIGGTRVIPFAPLNNVTNRRDSSSVVINAAGARYFEPALVETSLWALR
jgi:hypothetical protein